MRRGIQQIKDTPDIFSLRKSYPNALHMLTKILRGQSTYIFDTLKIIYHPVGAVVSTILPDQFDYR